MMTEEKTPASAPKKTTTPGGQPVKPISSANARGQSPIRLHNSVLQLSLAASLFVSIIVLFIVLAFLPFPIPLKLLFVLLGILAGLVCVIAISFSVLLLVMSRPYTTYDININELEGAEKLGTEPILDLEDGLVAKAIGRSFGRIYQAELLIYPTKLEIKFFPPREPKEIPLYEIKHIESFNTALRLDTADEAFYIFFGNRAGFLLLRRMETGHMDVFHRYLIDALRLYSIGRSFGPRARVTTR